MAILKPRPSLPIRWESGTKQSSKIISEVEEARIPILSSFFPIETPLALASTINKVSPRIPPSCLVLANKAILSAIGPLVIKDLFPLIRYPSSTFFA